MLRFPTKYHGFNASLLYWPEDLKEVIAVLDETPVVILWQCPLPLVAQLKRLIGWERQFQTPLIDLTRSEEDLWQQLEAKSCRYEIRKARKSDCQIICNDDLEAARILINDSIRKLQYRQELSVDEWVVYCARHDIYLCKHAGTAIAAHVIMKDLPGRVKLLLSGTADRNDESIRQLIGPLNRLLHWTEMMDYKAKGVLIYDFGGFNPDKDSSEYSIGQFKLSFGAQVVSEPILYLARNPVVRLRLRIFSVLRNLLKGLPWPENLRRVVRTHPQLTRLFR